MNYEGETPSGFKSVEYLSKSVNFFSNFVRVKKKKEKRKERKKEMPASSSVLGFETRAVHNGQDASKEKYRPAMPSIVNFCGNEMKHDNSTLKGLEECIASLESAKYALCYPSGMAAVTSITHILKDGDHVVMFDSVYHGSRTYLTMCKEMEKIQVSFVDLRDANVLKNHLKDNTRMVWIETPCNPTLKIVDIAAVAEILKSKKDIFLVVDNTFMSPYFQNPLLHGADIVMHSLTKYMSGHGDALMGAVATNDDLIYKKLKYTRDVIGTFPSPMDCYLVCRGLKTLHLRMEKHMENALAIARYLAIHPKVEKVYYLGLESHPQYAVAKKQCRGFGGMVSFCIRGGSKEAVELVQNLKTFTVAVSLGSTDSLIEVSSLMTAGGITKEKREEMGISENLLRMSVGLEDVKDLIADLDQAFEKIHCPSIVKPICTDL